MRRLTLFLSTQQWSKQNGGWNRLCSGNPGFFKSLGCCNRLLILFKTKRVKYTAIWKKSIKIVKESKPSFFFTLRTMFYLPLSLFNFISLLNFFYSLLHKFIIFPPQCFYSLLHNFYYFPSSMFFIPLLHLHLLISIVFTPPPPPRHFYCFPSTTTTTGGTPVRLSL